MPCGFGLVARGHGLVASHHSGEAEAGRDEGEGDDSGDSRAGQPDRTPMLADVLALDLVTGAAMQPGCQRRHGLAELAVAQRELVRAAGEP